ncbi:Zn(II)2Cys6 transcription factor domain-containing protein [Aspergillus undulatus]|uniref:Zn(II)2Cys6 transcription factor domain-containing protein n=1 Tax=Aspergillus undulatus TaxID=1810928 RepID=UPI003CCD4D59
MYRRQPPRRHACNRCVQLKVRCVPVESGACQRCMRLGHPSCVFPDNVRGKNNLKPESQQTSPESRSTPKQDQETNHFFHEAIGSDLAKKLLSKYKARKMPQYPFVIIPPETSLADLRRKSPFLLLCVLTASFEHDQGIQHGLEALVRQEVARRLIINVERNMDLLQGLLVHAAWYHYHWRTYHTHIYMLLQMAMMVVVDLGLDRQEGFRMQVIPKEGRKPDQGRGPSIHTADGQRALLGCYYLCSKSSIFRRQLDMRHTPWIDHCAEALHEQAECSTDLQLKHYIEVQSLARQSQLLFDEEQLSPDHAPVAIWERTIKMVTSHQARIKYTMASLRTDRDWPLLIELGAADALVLGQALRQQKDVFKLQELNHLTTLIKSARYVVDVFLSVPSAEVVHLPASTYATIWYALLSLSKLSLLFHPDRHQFIGVDKKIIQNRGVAIVRKFEEISVGADVWASSKKVVGNMLAWLNRTNAEPEPGSVSLNTRPASSQNGDYGAFQSSPREPWMDHPARPPTASSENAASLDLDMQFEPTDELDAAAWQQMLDNFTWFDAVMGSGLDRENEAM